MTRTQIMQELADLDRRVERGVIDAAAAAPRRRALEARLAEVSA